MPIVSVTRFRLRSPFHLPRFTWHAQATIRQLRSAPGFIRGAVLRDRGLALWTMTLWQAEPDMKAYMLSGAHLRAMPLLLRWGSEASVVRWRTDDDTMPDWQEADRRMRADGRLSKIRAPGPDHRGMTFPVPRTTTTAAIAPK